MDKRQCKVGWRASFCIFLALASLGFVQPVGANPGVSPQTIPLEKMCPGANWDQPCHWTGGAAGDIRGEIRIDESYDVIIDSIGVRSVGAQNWDWSFNFTKTMNGSDPSIAEGEIYWEDPFGNNDVMLGCNGVDDRVVDLQVITKYVSQGDTTRAVWTLQVIFSMYCKPCGTGKADTNGSGVQCLAPRDYDRELKAEFLVMNQSELPQTVSLILTDEWGWDVFPPVPASIDIAPGEVHALPILVTVPGGTPEGFTNDLTLAAEFLGDPVSGTAVSLGFVVDATCEATLVSTSSTTVPTLGTWALVALTLLLLGTLVLVTRRRTRMRP